MVNRKWDSSSQLRYLGKDCLLRAPVTTYDVTLNYNSVVLAYDFIPPTTGRPPNVPPYEDPDANTPNRGRKRGSFCTRNRGRAVQHRQGTSQIEVPSQSSRISQAGGQSLLSDISAKSRSPASGHTSTSTILGTGRIPPRPVLNARSTTDVPENPRAVAALDELLSAFQEEEKTPMGPPTSKAAAFPPSPPWNNKRRREANDALATSSNTRPCRRPQSAITRLPPPQQIDDTSAGEEGQTPAPHVQRRNRRDHNVALAIEYWNRVANPRHDSELILVDRIDPDVLVLLRRGKRFIELAPTLGINQATKTSRIRGKQHGRAFGEIRQQFEPLELEHNLTVLRLRGNKNLNKGR